MSVLKTQIAIEQAINNISDKMVFMIRESGVKPKTIAERMNMGNPDLVDRVMDAGVSQLSMSTLVRLAMACGMEMHVKFVPTAEGRVKKR